MAYWSPDSHGEIFVPEAPGDCALQRLGGDAGESVGLFCDGDPSVVSEQLQADGLAGFESGLGLQEERVVELVFGPDQFRVRQMGGILSQNELRHEFQLISEHFIPHQIRPE